MPSLQANRPAAQVQQVVLQQVVHQQALRRLRVRAVLRVVPPEERQVALPEEQRVVLQVVPRAVLLEELRVVLQVERQLVALRLLERQPEPQAPSQRRQVPLVQRLQALVWLGLSPRRLWLQRQ